MMGNSASLGPGLPYPGPCILLAVVESSGRARQTGSGPGPKRPQEAVGLSRPSFLAKKEPEQLPGPPRDKHGESPHPQGRAKTKEVPHMVDAHTEVYAGVDVLPRSA